MGMIHEIAITAFAFVAFLLTMFLLPISFTIFQHLVEKPE
jgi:hypothetical protein